MVIVQVAQFFDKAFLNDGLVIYDKCELQNKAVLYGHASNMDHDKSYRRMS